MTPRRPLVPDHDLWDLLKESIKPFGQRRHSMGLASDKLRTQLRNDHHSAHHPAISIRKTLPPPLSAFDRRTTQKLTRGQILPETRLDLHGETLESARIRLLHFLQECHHRGDRFVLVVTGKGASPFSRHTLHSRETFHAPERVGKLRREVLEWLSEAQFRALVIGYQPAHPRHGGGGAFYVKMRRNSSATT